MLQGDEEYMNKNVYVGPEWVTASFVRSLLLTIFISLITEGINLCLDPFLYEITKTLFPMLIFRREKSMLGINWKWRVVCISLRMKKFTYFAWCRLGFTLPISNLFMYFTFKLVKVFNFFFLSFAKFLRSWQKHHFCLCNQIFL